MVPASPCSSPLRGIGTALFRNGRQHLSAGIPPFTPACASFRRVRSADVYRLAVSGEIDIARDILEYEMLMQTLHLTQPLRVMKMSAGELEEERRRLLVELMLRKPDSVSMLAKYEEERRIAGGHGGRAARICSARAQA